MWGYDVNRKFLRIPKVVLDTKTAKNHFASSLVGEHAEVLGGWHAWELRPAPTPVIPGLVPLLRLPAPGVYPL